MANGGKNEVETKLAEKLGFEIEPSEKYPGLHDVVKDGQENLGATVEEIALWNLCLELSEWLRWISVEERLPELGNAVIGFLLSQGRRAVLTHTHGGYWREGSVQYWPLEVVTHWMPLAEAPDSERLAEKEKKA